MTALQADKRSGRIEEIDILRAFTLFGIIVVHMVEQFYAGMWPEQYANATTQTLADQITQGIVWTLISGKFYMIFSFLFGLSFFIQLSKNRPGKNFEAQFAWRLVILFIIGFIHHLHYRGDILTIYAVIALALLFLHRLPDNLLLAVAAFLILNVPSLILRGIQALFPSGENNPFGFNISQEELLQYYNTLKFGPYLDILRANFYEFATKADFQINSGRAYITLGLFLLGIYVGRKKIFDSVSLNVPMFKKFLRYSLIGVGGSIAFSLLFFGGLQLAGITLSQSISWMIGGFVMDIFNAALATFYVCGILLLYQKERWARRLSVLYPVGKMGLTTYVMQTLFGTLIFFSYGLGLLGEIGALLCLLLAIGLFAVQIMIARFWLKHFTQGPVEWLWRNLTYLEVQPMSRTRAIQEAKVN